MRRVLCAILILAFVPLPALALGEGAVAAILIDAESGRVLYEKNADALLPMASVTKVMTALIALENASLTDPVTAGDAAYGVPGTSLYLGRGETLSMEQMLYGLLLRSGNDAAVAIAEHVAGSVDAFCTLMNRRAESLGADAHFENPHGLDQAGHRASARALALIFRECMKNEAFRAITGTRRKVIPWTGNDFSRLLVNKNRLLSEYPGATGGKTGFTRGAGRCLVFSAQRDGVELIGVVLSCGNWFSEAEEMLDYGFDNYGFLVAAEEGKEVARVTVYGGTEREVPALTADKLTSLLREGEQWRVEARLTSPSLTAPVKAGEVVGEAVLWIGGEAAARVALVTAGDVPEDSFGYAIRRIWGNWGIAGLWC